MFGGCLGLVLSHDAAHGSICPESYVWQLDQLSPLRPQGRGWNCLGGGIQSLLPTRIVPRETGGNQMVNPTEAGYGAELPGGGGGGLGEQVHRGFCRGGGPNQFKGSCARCKQLRQDTKPLPVRPDEYPSNTSLSGPPWAVWHRPVGPREASARRQTSLTTCA